MNPNTGVGAVATWCGKSVLIAKVTNFMYAYTMRKMGFSLAMIKAGGEWGTDDDPAAIVCYELGFLIANGASYVAQVEARSVELWQKTNSNEHKILWPNLYSPNSGNFTSPGWLTTQP